MGKQKTPTELIQFRVPAALRNKVKVLCAKRGEKIKEFGERALENEISNAVARREPKNAA